MTRAVFWGQVCTRVAQGRSFLLLYGFLECQVTCSFACSLTALFEKGPSFTRTYSKQWWRKPTHTHSLVPFKTVTGAHGLRHLQEAAGVLQPHEGAPIKGCSHVEWKTISASALLAHTQDGASGRVNWGQRGFQLPARGASLAGLGRTMAAWSLGGPPALCKLCQYRPQTPGCP